MSEVAEQLGERVLSTPNNPISMGMTLSKFDIGGEKATYLGSMLFQRFCSGVRTVAPNSAQTICGIKFAHYGSHLAEAYPSGSYLTVACGIGMKRSEVDEFCVRLLKASQQFFKQRDKRAKLNAELKLQQPESRINESIAVLSSIASSSTSDLELKENDQIYSADSALKSQSRKNTLAFVASSSTISSPCQPISHAFSGNPLNNSHLPIDPSAEISAVLEPTTTFMLVCDKKVVVSSVSGVYWTSLQSVGSLLQTSNLDILVKLLLARDDSSSSFFCVNLGHSTASSGWKYAVDLTPAFLDSTNLVKTLSLMDVNSGSFSLQVGRALMMASTFGGASLPSTSASVFNINSEELSIAGQACGLLEWHASAKFCGRCGSPTTRIECGMKRSCTSSLMSSSSSSASSAQLCRNRLYPRIDPVAIVLVHHVGTGRALLVRQSSYPAGWYTAISGFVDICESLEEAVQREVLEEAGVLVKNLTRYHSSQPWPFGRGSSCQLMIGFTAEVDSDSKVQPPAIQADPREIEDARWFSKQEVRAAISSTANDASTLKSIPGQYAIAHHLIKHWLEYL